MSNNFLGAYFFKGCTLTLIVECENKTSSPRYIYTLILLKKRKIKYEKSHKQYAIQKIKGETGALCMCLSCLVWWLCLFNACSCRPRIPVSSQIHNLAVIPFQSIWRVDSSLLSMTRSFECDRRSSRLWRRFHILVGSKGKCSGPNYFTYESFSSGICSAKIKQAWTFSFEFFLALVLCQKRQNQGKLVECDVRIELFIAQSLLTSWSSCLWLIALLDNFQLFYHLYLI